MLEYSAAEHCGQQWWHCVTDQSCDLFLVSREMKTVWKSLESRAFSEGDVSVFEWMSELAASETIKTTCYGACRFVRSQTTVDVTMSDLGCAGAVTIYSQMDRQGLKSSSGRNM